MYIIPKTYFYAWQRVTPDFWCRMIVSYEIACLKDELSITMKLLTTFMITVYMVIFGPSKFRPSRLCKRFRSVLKSPRQSHCK